MRAGSRSGPPSDHAGRTGGYYHLLRAVIYRDLLIWVRYPVNAGLRLFINLLFFGMLFYGGTLLAGEAMADSLEGLIVGYFLWTLSTGAYSGLINDVQAEAGWGTLERHFVTPFGFGPVVLAKGVAIVLRTFLISAVVLAVMLLATGTRLDVHLPTVVPVATLAVASALGLGLAMGGLSVLYKRISNVANLLSFAFVGLISAPVFDVWWTAFLPLVAGSALLQLAMTEGVRLWALDPALLAVLVGTAIGYPAIGYVVFDLATKRARRLGVLGDY